MAKAAKKDRVEVEVLPIYFDYVLNKSYPVIILVGGRNSGKSHFMQQLSVLNLNNRPEYKLLVVEDVETNIGEGVKAGIEERSEEFGLDKFFFSTKVPPEITHKITGNKVIFKGYHSEAQQKQVKS
jgi:phage terminase large subunit